MPAGPLLRVRFTLVELAIVVAVIALLAAIAMPLLRDYQLRSRRTEVPVNLVAIADAFFAAADTTTLKTGGIYPRPDTALGKTSVPWSGGTYSWPGGNAAALGLAALAATEVTFDAVDFRPDGEVRCSYMGAGGMAIAGTARTAWAVAFCDLDDDNVNYAATDGIPTGAQMGAQSQMCFDAGHCYFGEPNCTCF